MRTRLRRTLTGLLSVGLLFGCGGKSSPTGGAGGGGPVTGRINGVAWSTDAAISSAVFDQSENTLVIFGGSITSYAITIGLPGVTSPGTYQLGDLASLRFAALSAIGGGSWGSFHPGGSGTVTINTYSQNRLIGTFQLVAPADQSSTDQTTLTITDGRFDLPLLREQ